MKKFRVGTRNNSTESTTPSNCGQLCQSKIIFGGIKNQAQIRALLKNKQTNKKNEEIRQHDLFASSEEQNI